MIGPFCIVVNPAAGRGRSLRALPAVTAALDAADATYHVSQSASMDEARQLAGRAAQLGHVVVAVGGDGTAGVLAGVVASTAGRYAIIPAGRGNDLARVLGIPADPAAAAAVLLHGQLRKIDLIGVTAPGYPEIMVAGSVYAGVPSVAGQLANQARWLPGPLLYPVAALRALARWAPATFLTEITGPEGGPPGGARRQVRGYAIVVANAAYFGAGMQVAPGASIDDGMLDIVIMRDGPKLAFVRALARIRGGGHLALPQVSLEHGTEVMLSVDRDLPAAADGDTLPCADPLPAGAPLRLRALPGALSVVTPR
ncbi:MAG TPA: diacylglycerol kinase family protein [Streptosporangiaceae bacterium]|jgi:YegS/Rv2252/BmrU family lipid kinase